MSVQIELVRHRNGALCSLIPPYVNSICVHMNKVNHVEIFSIGMIP